MRDHISITDSVHDRMINDNVRLIQIVVRYVCNPILVTTFPECFSGTEHGRAHPAPCVRPRRVCSVFACTRTVLPV